jgi:DNA polymerase-3 subunit delta
MPSLDFDAFLRSLKKGEILPAYYFHGDEDLLKDDAVRDLLAAALDPSTRDFNLDRRRSPELTAEDFTTLALTPPMLTARRAVVIGDVEALQLRRPRAQALRAAIVGYLERPSPDTLLILIQSPGEKPDPELVRRTASVAFGALPPDRIRRWIQHRAQAEGLAIDDDGARHLHAVVGDDLAQMAAELSKLAGAVQGRAATASDVADLVGVRRGETVPDFVGAVSARRFAAAVEMIPHLLSGPGSSGVRLVSSLGTALTGLALARAHLDAGVPAAAVPGRLVNAMKAVRPIGLRDYGDEADRWTRDASDWSAAELTAALAELLRADRRLKGTTLGGDGEIVADALLAMAGAGRVAA